ncbi:MAG: hypothetical protein H0X04_00360 [Chthoniobacterales bacterium]|nr:hypothetical protein [Chthoniobacterales bacterium]
MIQLYVRCNGRDLEDYYWEYATTLQPGFFTNKEAARLAFETSLDPSVRCICGRDGKCASSEIIYRVEES